MTLKLGVIGTGAIGQDHIRRCNNVLQGAKVVAVSDINVEGARAALQRLNIEAEVYQDGHQVINSPEVDAILVTSWDPTHEEFTLAAIAAGKPVFCEKPLAMSAEGCRRIVDAEIKHGKRLVQVGFMRPYDSGYRALKKVITDGEIGEPLMLHCAHRNQSVGGKLHHRYGDHQHPDSRAGCAALADRGRLQIGAGGVPTFDLEDPRQIERSANRAVRNPEGHSHRCRDLRELCLWL